MLHTVRKSRYFSIALTISLLFLSVAFWVVDNPKANTTFGTLPTLKNVLLVKNNQTHPTFPLSDPTPVTLPHGTRLNNNFAWYLASFSAEPAIDLWSVFIADKSWDVEIFVNGNLVGSADDKLLDQPNWQTPVIATFSSNLLKPENNQLAIRLSAPNAIAHLSPIVIGDYKSLSGIYSIERFRTVTIQQIIALLIWLTFLFATFLWIKRKSDAAYFWFAITTLMWAIHASIKLIPTPYFINFELWRFIMNAALLWFVVAAFFFISRTVGKKNRNFEMGLFIVASIFQLIYVLFQNLWPQYYGYFSVYVFMSFIVLTGTLSFYRLVSSSYFSRHIFLLTLCTIIVFNVGVHDYLLLTGTIHGSALLQFTAPILIILFLIQLVSRYVISLQHKEEIFQSYGLESLPSEGNQSVNWERIKESERLKTVSQERKRLQQELHDGVSGSLVSVISSLRMGKPRSQEMLISLEECMQELRSVFDGDSCCEQNLSALLGTYRQKIQQKLNMLNISLEWKIFDLADDVELDVTQANHVSRIIQESFTNIIKHAQANSVVFEASSEKLDDSPAYQVVINILDNGSNGNLNISKGNGLTNMRERAQQLGGEFLASFSEVGGKISLIFKT